MPIDRTRLHAGRERRAANEAVSSSIIQGGRLVLASTIVLLGGSFNVVDGLVALFRPSYFVGQPVFGDLWIWAVLWMGFGFLQMAAGGAILAGAPGGPASEVRMQTGRSGVTGP